MKAGAVLHALHGGDLTSIQGNQSDEWAMNGLPIDVLLQFDHIGNAGEPVWS
jgi:hypothetical protein